MSTMSIWRRYINTSINKVIPSKNLFRPYFETIKKNITYAFGIFLAVLLIGITTFGFCTAGVKLGNLLGCKFEKPAQIAGGSILILLGLKILLEGLGILVL